MRCRGRSFAAGALLMLLAQFTVLCAAPLATCTMTASMAAQHGSIDCCPAGSHPPGQCPLHKREASSGGCRLTCAKQGTTPFIPGFAGVLTPTIVAVPVILSEPAVFTFHPARIVRSLPPVSPPPKHLG